MALLATSEPEQQVQQAVRAVRPAYSSRGGPTGPSRRLVVVLGTSARLVPLAVVHPLRVATRETQVARLTVAPTVLLRGPLRVPLQATAALLPPREAVVAVVVLAGEAATGSRRRLMRLPFRLRLALGLARAATARMAALETTRALA